MIAVALFAKAPVAGRVKTRLAADIGPAAAAAQYRRVGHMVATAVARNFAVTVWYDPPDAEPLMRAWLGEHTFRPQRGRDLGERMAHAFQSHFAMGDAPVFAIGADCPGVDAFVIAEAARHLARHDVVIGPSVDGGYYLLGLHAHHANLFSGIPWSTADVFRITAERCRAVDLSVAVMPTLRDLDTRADLEALGLECP